MRISMPMSVHHIRSEDESCGTPFSSVDEAWIWASKSMNSRLAGANVKGGMAAIERPCEATDILLCARVLNRSGVITDTELAVLVLYGGYSCPPSKLGESHMKAVPFWTRATDALEVVLEQKGIIYGKNCGTEYGR